MPLVDGVPGPHVVVNLWESEHEGRVGLHLPQDDVLDGGAGALVGLQVGQLADRISRVKAAKSSIYCMFSTFSDIMSKISQQDSLSFLFGLG